MTRTPRAVAALLLVPALLLGACAHEDDNRTSPSDPPAASPAAPLSPPSRTTSEPPVDDPSPFQPAVSSTDGLDRGTACTEVPASGTDLLLWEALTVRRPATVVGLEAVGRGVEVGQVTYVRRSPGEVLSSGGWPGDAPPPAEQDRLHWADREPLRGTELQPGRYYWFAETHVAAGARLRQVELPYLETVGARTDSAVSRYAQDYRESCRGF